MSIDQATVRRVAQLARISLAEHEVPHLQGELNAILAFVAELDAVDVAEVEPMTSVLPMSLKRRRDEITDGGIAGKIVANAAASEDNLFAVPKVIE
jgi:aspartyl-tRNA(Asn)/glutamyl-tRNA(Gln) amidotransferase subunit C